LNQNQEGRHLPKPSHLRYVGGEGCNNQLPYCRRGGPPRHADIGPQSKRLTGWDFLTRTRFGLTIGFVEPKNQLYPWPNLPA
jgi:hypothetical protein